MVQYKPNAAADPPHAPVQLNHPFIFNVSFPEAGQFPPFQTFTSTFLNLSVLPKPLHLQVLTFCCMFYGVKIMSLIFATTILTHR